jgi:hypothetical protein
MTDPGGGFPRQRANPRPLTAPQGLILAVAVLVLTNIPFRYGWVWPTVATLLALWELWRHSRLAWAALTAVTALTLVQYGLTAAGVISTSLPRWWIPVPGAADIAALAILLSPPVRRWVAKQPARALLSSALTRSWCVWGAGDAQPAGGAVRSWAS